MRRLYKIDRIATGIEVLDHEVRALMRIFPSDEGTVRIYKDEKAELTKLKEQFPILHEQIISLLKKESNDFLELSDET